jgi:YHS domain-containing protein
VFRIVLFVILSVFVARAFWRMVDGVIEGLSGRPPGSPGGPGNNVQGRGVQMARDPVCGTYVVPDRAVTVTDGRRQIFFCSTACRDKYRARTA